MNDFQNMMPARISNQPCTVFKVPAIDNVYKGYIGHRVTFSNAGRVNHPTFRVKFLLKFFTLPNFVPYTGTALSTCLA